MQYMYKMLWNVTIFQCLETDSVLKKKFGFARNNLEKSSNIVDKKTCIGNMPSQNDNHWIVMNLVNNLCHIENIGNILEKED